MCRARWEAYILSTGRGKLVVGGPCPRRGSWDGWVRLRIQDLRGPPEAVLEVRRHRRQGDFRRGARPHHSLRKARPGGEGILQAPEGQTDRRGGAVRYVLDTRGREAPHVASGAAGPVAS